MSMKRDLQYVGAGVTTGAAVAITLDFTELRKNVGNGGGYAKFQFYAKTNDMVINYIGTADATITSNKLAAGNILIPAGAPPIIIEIPLSATTLSVIARGGTGDLYAGSGY